MPTWTPIAEGAPIAVASGQSLAVVASVKASHTADDLRAFAAARGLTVTDYAEEGQRARLGPDPRSPGYRYVAAVGTAGAPVSLPWAPPWPVSMFDDSQLVQAWIGAPAGSAAPAPGPPASPRAAMMPSSVALWALGLGGAWALWRMRARARARGAVR